MSNKWQRVLLGNGNVQQFVKGEDKLFAPLLIGDRYEVDGILSTSGGFGIIFTAKDNRLLGRRVLIKARRYDNEPALFTYPKDIKRKEKIEKIRKQIKFEYNCLLNFRKKGESRMPNVNHIIEGFSPFIYGPHRAADGSTFYYNEPEIYNKEPYIIMQMIEGGNLGDYVSEGIDKVIEDRGYKSYHQWEKDVLQYALELCTMFNEFHRKDEGHRYYIYQDLKPDNIMITENMFLTLIDFGGMTLVKEKNGVAASNLGFGSAGLGTWGYKAPEMDPTRGMLENLDQRVDIYAIGATLYHLLTGDDLSKPPHKEYGKVPVENLKKFGYIQETFELIEMATKQNRDERYKTTKDMADQIYKAFTGIKKV